MAENSDSDEIHSGPAHDWYCGCRETAPDRVGTISILRPSSQSYCFRCGRYAPWIKVGK